MLTKETLKEVSQLREVIWPRCIDISVNFHLGTFRDRLLTE
jgi:hypothetical protein